MLKKLEPLPVYFALVIILVGIVLTGCSASGAGQSSAPVDQQSSPVSTQGQSMLSNQQTSSTQTQQQTATSGQQTPAPADSQRMDKIFSRVAEILGVTEDQLTKAFQQAMPSVSGAQPPSGQQQPPAPPSGQLQPPPTLPSDNTSGSSPSGQQPPQQGQRPSAASGGPDMTSAYSKMAEILNISADKISSAFEQAQNELKK